MTEDSCSKISEGSIGTAASAARQRKKRKWDQPAESLISAGLAVPGVLPLGNMGTLVGITLPGVASLSSALSTNPVPASCAIMPQAFHAPSIQQNAVAVLQKLNQPKIQDELIAREIVINDAEPTVRYKLTKRQTQEEIQRSTGAVVITRGKYRPPNAIPDSEKPLYLHISAGAHLKETAERIKAVDRAAVMVEEMLKQGLNLNPDSTTFHSAINTGAQAPQPLNTCVFLGFETDPSLNIAARIRGPNDQYINHIMNETGATVLLRGRGSGNFENPNGEESQQALHLYLSSNNPKSLEDAKLLAENLLDTISLECGASRASSSKVYNAVPPPQQLLAGFQSAGKEQRVNAGPVVGLTSSTVGYGPAPPMSSATLPGVSGVFPQPNMISYPQNSVSGGTSYSGYGGIYPQATPLQQVALALRQSPSLVTSAVAPVTSAGNTLPKANSSSTTGMEKHPPQKRKFQELPGALKGPAKPHQNSLQGSEFLKPGPPSEDSNLRNTSTMPPPKKLVRQSSNGMSPPPRRAMPPPPPKFESPATLSKVKDKNSMPIKSTSDTVPDTLIKLMEYGDGDDDDDDDGPEGTGEEENCENNSNSMTAWKPFWAV